MAAMNDNRVQTTELETGRISDLRSSIDPFSPRSGQTLEWCNLDLSLKEKPKNLEKDDRILKNLSGKAKPGELTCLMGASGSGKTSLLQTLAGRSSQYKMEGNIYLDGQEIDPSSQTLQKKIAFVGQHDKLLATATPREAIRFAARLRLPRSTTDKEIDGLTERILEELRLTSVADTMIGGDKVKSLSGGEMRRVSLGVQLVVVPKMLFLDEITSGLDSRNAAVVMDVCKNVAAAGTTMLIVIHQPSSNIFKMMDHLVLLDHGRTMYQGPADRAMDYFAGRGHPMPENYNPADWLLQVPLDTSKEELEKSGFFAAPESSDGSTDESSEKMGSLDLSESKETNENTHSANKINNKEARATLWTQTKEQLRRDIRNIVRDSNGLKMRFLCAGGTGVLTAISYANVGDDSTHDAISFSSHVGAIFFLLLGTTIIMQLVLFDFIEVREMYIREFRSQQYGIVSYAMSKLAVDIVTSSLLTLLLTLLVWWTLSLQGHFLYFWLIMTVLTLINGSSSYLLGAVPGKNPKDALEFIVLLILPQLLFSGFFVDQDSLPVWISWISYLMPTFYAFKLVLADEFDCLDGEGINAQQLTCLESISDVLDSQESVSALFQGIEGCDEADPSSLFQNINPPSGSFCAQFLESQNATGANDTLYWCILIALFVVIRSLSLLVLRARAKGQLIPDSCMPKRN